MRRLLLASLLLTGCSTTVPVHMSFPELPEALAKPCERMEPLAEGKRELSDLLENTTDNYAKAKECNAKSTAWKEWYDTQRKIFEEVK